MILFFGPLKHLWTLRFESKHRYFKNIIKHSQNFKNITKLFSLKHQFLQSVERNTYRTSVIADNAEIYIPENFESISFVLTDYFSDKSENFKYIVSKVIFKGIIYKTGMSICVGKNCYDYFLICKIKYLLIDDCYSSIYFLGKMIKVILYIIPILPYMNNLNLKVKNTQWRKYLYFHILPYLHHILFSKHI